MCKSNDWFLYKMQHWAEIGQRVITLKTQSKILLASLRYQTEVKQKYVLFKKYFPMILSKFNNILSVSTYCIIFLLYASFTKNAQALLTNRHLLVSETATGFYKKSCS